ncbi:extracellular solute-binding protein [Acholeplasma laidlawii]|uniref:ABC-type transport system, substrate-binding component n=3 Tax=Acholeplasma laidlawii TaxID=2148 RepID=A9NG60_ACHLI|nr:extracellular solute-binding protein [Acholeplasma laidlawii]ABX81340.1 ABC-type transport system, substrate-binding component [Acholeplasma laidlawii PG-8A]NWH11470.1 extracellular solute-binding protein [Acholeplasma laidlawii]NWH13120.1 extracellular solute-binding protein [Acholeplasma laidlawii]NWH14612.1 extracellular solute-binding protein [Acholeplasma laidlawii]OAN19629.1 ABC transporter substrate-binding protein [Acholeplasma laidlawii]
MMGKIKRSIVWGLATVLLVFAIIYFTRGTSIYKPDGTITNDLVSETKTLLNASINNARYTYVDYLSDHQQNVDYGLSTITASLTNSDALIDSENMQYSLIMTKDKIATYEIEIQEAGYYHVGMNYKVSNATLNQITIALKINDESYYQEMQTIELPIIWQDESKNYLTDRYGDEVLPNQIIMDDWQYVAAYNNTYISIDPLLFYFKQGLNQLTIENTSSSKFIIGDIDVFKPVLQIDYDTYINQNNYEIIDGIIDIDATNYSYKNSSYVQAYSEVNPSVLPFDPVYKKLNVIDGRTWQRPGQSLTYEVNVEKSGLYKLAFRYSNPKADFPVFRSIKINGQIPFNEVRAYQFKSTKAGNWRVETLGNEQTDYYFYFQSGKNTITLRAESEPVQEAVRNIQMLIDHINTFTLEIRKITGKEVDKNRTWRFSEQMPESKAYLESYILLLKASIDELSLFAPNGAKSATISNLQKSLSRAENIYKDYNRLPLYLEDLVGGTGSINQFLGDILDTLNNQQMYLNQLHLYNNTRLRKANPNIFESLYAGTQSFIASFSSNKYALTKEDGVLDVWVNRPITYVDMMQKMADQTFTPQTGIQVKISVMPDANKLVMASAANQQPDVALGLASYMPFDLAIRNSAYDLTSFDDYWEFASQFAPGAFVPYILNDKAYALPETLDFNVVMYRKDIFDALNFMVPDTWEEVIQILPELQKYGMNFYHPIAGGTAIKWFYQTSGFIYQFGGNIYSEDGLRTSINEKEAVQGLTFLNQLFTNYALPEQVVSFYNSFRYATLPIGIADFGTYQLIKNAAPELTGMWEIAPYPSITTEAAGTNRHYIANGTAGMIMNETDQPDDAWDFLKWWMSTETQSQFSFNLQSTYGPTYAWISGNINAFMASPFSEKDKEVILEQIKWLIDVPRTPGQYMLERSISDIWNTAVFDGTPTGIAVDRYTILINREMRKKMIEFGFLDNEGNLIKPYVIRDITWVRNQMLDASGGYHGSND